MSLTTRDGRMVWKAICYNSFVGVKGTEKEQDALHFTKIFSESIILAVDDAMKNVFSSGTRQRSYPRFRSYP